MSDKLQFIFILGVILGAVGSKGIIDCFYIPHLTANIITAFLGLLVILFALLKE